MTASDIELNRSAGSNHSFPTPQPKHVRTLYMQQVERNRIRRLMLQGRSVQEIGEEIGMSYLRVEVYIREIRNRDHESLAQQDHKTRAAAIQSMKESLEYLREKMLEIVNGNGIPTAKRDKIAAAALVRQFDADLVNLTLNGPMAAGLPRNIINVNIGHNAGDQSTGQDPSSSPSIRSLPSSQAESDDTDII